jgi:hypothetical protein
VAKALSTIIRNVIYAAVLLLFAAILPLSAQGDCPAIVQQALNTAGQVCIGLTRNQVCYGHNHIEATDWEGFALPNFTQPGSMADLLNMAALATFPFDEQTQTWGVAMMAVQADLEETLPGQNVTLVVYGDVDVENGVEPGKKLAPQMIPGVSNSNPNLRLGPGTSYAIAGSLAPEEAVTVIGQNEAGDWFQILRGNDVRWVAARFITLDDETAVLKVADPNTDPILLEQPMQAFQVRTRPGRPPVCDEAPRDGVVIQAPKDTTVNFLVNGIEMRVGSTALILPGESEDQMEVATLGGTIGLSSGGVEQVVLPGFTTQVIAGSAPTEPEPYEYEDVHGLPGLLTLLPETVNAPPPVGTEVSAYLCHWNNGGVLRNIVPSDQPLIFGEAFGGVDEAAALAVRENTTVTMTLDGEEIPLWSISDPYTVDDSTQASSGRQTGAAVVQKWWFVIPRPEPGPHQAVITWTKAAVDQYRCSFTVQ